MCGEGVYHQLAEDQLPLRKGAPPRLLRSRELAVGTWFGHDGLGNHLDKFLLNEASEVMVESAEVEGAVMVEGQPVERRSGDLATEGDVLQDDPREYGVRGPLVLALGFRRETGGYLATD